MLSRLAETAPCAHVEPTPATYARRRPDQTVLYGVAREHAETLFAEARERSDGGYGYPAQVENARESIDAATASAAFSAGDFCRVHCAGCGRDELVAFSWGPRTILAAIAEPEPIRTILTHLGLPTGVPALADARAPPQHELFDP